MNPDSAIARKIAAARRAGPDRRRPRAPPPARRPSGRGRMPRIVALADASSERRGGDRGIQRRRPRTWPS
ncbi:MAG: hypothetical protein MZV64_28380 [Ignavibacteriales bacterium]|nr:hypothetical protein [Ignavibacteriales bacterium]